jgi:hypothetical protein
MCVDFVTLVTRGEVERTRRRWPGDRIAGYGLIGC